MFRKLKTRRIAVAILAMSLLIFAGLTIAYVNIAYTKLRIANLSSETLENIEVRASEKIIWVGYLRPKMAKNIWFNPKRDGNIQLTAIVQGQSVDSGELGYVSPNIGGRELLIYKKQNEFDLKPLP